MFQCGDQRHFDLRMESKKRVSGEEAKRMRGRTGAELKTPKRKAEEQRERERERDSEPELI